MTGTIYHGTYANGLTLANPTTQNPATLAVDGMIGGTGLLAGAQGTAWTVSNFGSIRAIQNFGVSLSSGGTLINAAGALVTGGAGVGISGGVGVVQNAGSIAYSTRLYAGGAVTNTTLATIGGVIVQGGLGSVVNAGSAGYFDLQAGGSVTNSAGTIANGVRVSGSAGSVTNSATVSNANARLLAGAVSLSAGGYVSNASGGMISAAAEGVIATTLAATVMNAGTIMASQSLAHYGSATLQATHGVYLVAGGTVINVAGGVLSAGGSFSQSYAANGDQTVSGIELKASGSVVNAGTIFANGTFAAAFRNYTLGAGIYAMAGANVSNFSTGTISVARSAIVITGDGTVGNAGRLFGTSAYGVSLRATGVITNMTGGLISGGFDGVRAVNATAVSVDNSGSIDGPQNYAIRLNGGTVTNHAGARLSGGNDGVLFDALGGTLVNAGTIAGAGTYRTTLGSGVYMTGAGQITNSSGGSIAGRLNGIALRGAGGSIVNAGTATGTATYGIVLASGGTVGNSGTATGGVAGLKLGGGLTAASGATVTNTGLLTGATGLLVDDSKAVVSNILTNAGAIVGTGGTAVKFGGGNDRLVVLPGASFSGIVDGGAGSNVLELGQGAGTLSGLGTTVVNFGRIVLDAGAAWKLVGTQAGFAGPISGFAAGSTIDLAGLHESIVGYASGTLSLTGDVALSLQLPGSFTTASFKAGTDTNGGTAVTVACFAAGTLIATPHGDRLVESLTAGTPIVSHFGGAVAVTWVGRRLVDCARHPDPSRVWPVRVVADAFAPGMPARDLLLSPDHAIFHAGLLIPIRTLINGSSIRQERRLRVLYVHVECPSHDVLLAEGLPAETYLDTGNRSDFAGGGPALRLHPDFARDAWLAGACAPQCNDGPVHQALRARLEARADAIEIGIAAA